AQSGSGGDAGSGGNSGSGSGGNALATAGSGTSGAATSGRATASQGNLVGDGTGGPDVDDDWFAQNFGGNADS
ncbi:MAG: hypothetical protein ACRDJW_09350, partial [Thermomicrobiales bacterium]